MHCILLEMFLTRILKVKTKIANCILRKDFVKIETTFFADLIQSFCQHFLFKIPIDILMFHEDVEGQIIKQKEKKYYVVQVCGNFLSAKESKIEFSQKISSLEFSHFDLQNIFVVAFN